jgi:hypothetical protein
MVIQNAPRSSVQFLGIGSQNLGHVLDQEKAQDGLSGFGRPSYEGKVPEIFPLELRPGDEFEDPQPPVPLIQPASERKKFGEKNVRVTVFRLAHAAELPCKVHRFRRGVGEMRAFGTWKRSTKFSLFILLSLRYVALALFSEAPNYSYNIYIPPNFYYRYEVVYCSIIRFYFGANHAVL